jgi:hypothetical protein
MAQERNIRVLQMVPITKSAISILLIESGMLWWSKVTTKIKETNNGWRKRAESDRNRFGRGWDYYIEWRRVGITIASNERRIGVRVCLTSHDELGRKDKGEKLAFDLFKVHQLNDHM